MATDQPPGDPRPFARLPGEAGVMPVVARPRAGLSNLAIGLGVAAAGVLLFTMLDSRRRDTAAPAVRVRASDRLQTASPPPPLFVPPAAPAPVMVPVVRIPVAAAPTPAPAAPQIVYVPQPYPVPAPAPEAPPPPPQHIAPGPALVVDMGAAGPAAAGAGAADSPAIAAAGIAGVRARAGA